MTSPQTTAGALLAGGIGVVAALGGLALLMTAPTNARGRDLQACLGAALAALGLAALVSTAAVLGGGA